MKIILTILSILLLASSSIAASSNTSGKKVIINIPQGGYPPFIFTEGGKNPSGIMYDIFHKILLKHGYKLSTATLPKKREFDELKSGRVDVLVTALEWVPEPKDYLYSDSVFNIRNVVFMRSDSAFSYKSIDDLTGQNIITHTGYLYPPLETKFRRKKLRRIDGKNELSMLKMLSARRAPFAIMNDLTGQWIINQQGWQGKFKLSREAITDYGYRFVFNKKWEPLVPIINSELSKMKKDGEIEYITRKYLPPFPL